MVGSMLGTGLLIERKIFGGAGVGAPFAKGKFAVGGANFALAGEAEAFLESGGGGFGMVWVEHRIAGFAEQLADIPRIRTDDDTAEGHA